MCLRTSEHPYLISFAFHIAEGCCDIFINPCYAVSCFPVEPFSSASSKNVYKTIVRMSMGLVCVVLWHLISERVFGAKYDHTFSKLANHQIRHQATHKVGCQLGDCIWSLYSGDCVGMYEFTYSFYHPQGHRWHIWWNICHIVLFKMFSRCFYANKK